MINNIHKKHRSKARTKKDVVLRNIMVNCDIFYCAPFPTRLMQMLINQKILLKFILRNSILLSNNYMCQFHFDNTTTIFTFLYGRHKVTLTLSPLGYLKTRIRCTQNQFIANYVLFHLNRQSLPMPVHEYLNGAKFDWLFFSG